MEHKKTEVVNKERDITLARHRLNVSALQTYQHKDHLVHLEKQHDLLGEDILDLNFVEKNMVGTLEKCGFETDKIHKELFKKKDKLGYKPSS